VSFIRENSGSHFDPDVVACFERCLPDIIKIREMHQEPKNH